MSELPEILIPIVLFALVFGLFYVYISARHKERLALIEKGADASIFNTGANGRSAKNLTLRWGLFFIGIAIGVLMGNVMSIVGLVEPVAYISMIFLFGGLGLISYYIFFKSST